MAWGDRQVGTTTCSVPLSECPLMEGKFINGGKGPRVQGRENRSAQVAFSMLSMLSTLINKITDAMDAVQSIRNRTKPPGN